MTTYGEARKLAYQLWESDWLPDTGVDGYTVADSVWSADPDGKRTPYTFDGEEFDPPANLPWVRVSVRTRDRAQKTIGHRGNRCFETDATIFVQYFQPIDIDGGVGVADGHIEKILSIFEGKRISGSSLRVINAVPDEGGPDPDQRWWAATVRIGVDYTERK